MRQIPPAKTILEARDKFNHLAAGRPANSKFSVNEIGLILSRRFCRDKFDFAWHRRGKRSKFINKRNGDLSVRPQNVSVCF